MTSHFDTSFFSKPIERRGSGSYKWDSAENPDMLPMWVADMDFATAPAIIESLQQRVNHGVFGYAKVPLDYYSAVQNWFRSRHNFTIDGSHLLYTTGVVPALSAIIQALCPPGRGVIVQTPAYNCFFSSIRNSQCEQIFSPLVYDKGCYHIDFYDLERLAADPNNTVLLLCNPHNPVGRCWTEEELRRMGDICIDHGVTVLADEVHCDLVMPGYNYCPFASLGDRYLKNSITCTSPSKGFNLAGLQVANILASDDGIRRRIDKQLNINEVCEVSPFAIAALLAAYNNGSEWLDGLRDYLLENYDYLTTYFKEHLPMLHVLPLEATYLVWVDISALGIHSRQLCEQLRKRQNLWLSEGTIYGQEGEGFIRINIATQRTRLKDGLDRIKAELNLKLCAS